MSVWCVHCSIHSNGLSANIGMNFSVCRNWPWRPKKFPEVIPGMLLVDPAVRRKFIRAMLTSPASSFEKKLLMSLAFRSISQQPQCSNNSRFPCVAFHSSSVTTPVHSMKKAVLVSFLLWLKNLIKATQEERAHNSRSLSIISGNLRRQALERNLTQSMHSKSRAESEHVHASVQLTFLTFNSTRP